MEIIQIDDVRVQIVELKKLVRVVEPGQHPVLEDGTSVRQADFQFSKDRQWVEENLTTGLSFVTSMKKFKQLIKLRQRHVAQVDIYAIDEHAVHLEGLRFIHDKPGHVSLVVSLRMKVVELISRLEVLASKMEPVGRMWVSP